MPTGIPKNGINTGWFKKGQHYSLATEFKSGNKPIAGFKKGNKINWKGGKRRHGQYIEIHSPGHPFCNKAKYVFEHRLVMEKHLGRYLKPEEEIHHINNNRSDNRIKNLKLFKNKSKHMKFHHLVRVKKFYTYSKNHHKNLGLNS